MSEPQFPYEKNDPVVRQQTDAGSGKHLRIAQAALRLFVSRGFHDTPTSLIAKEAGVANGTLFNYYRSKEELINSLYLDLKKSLVLASADGLEHLAEFPSRLERVWNNTLDWALEHPLEIAFIQQYSHSPFLAAHTQQNADEMASLYTGLLRDGIRDGFLLDLDPNLMYFSASQQLFGLLTFLQMQSDSGRNRKLRKQAFAMFLRSVTLESPVKSTAEKSGKTSIKKR